MGNCGSCQIDSCPCKTGFMEEYERRREEERRRREEERRRREEERRRREEERRRLEEMWERRLEKMWERFMEEYEQYMKYCEMMEELGGGYRILLQSIEAEHDFIKLLGDLRMKSVEAKLVKVYIDGRLHSRANDGITLLKVCGTKIMMHSEKKITPRKIRKLTRKEEANEKYGRYIKDSYELWKGLSKEDMTSFYGNHFNRNYTVTAYPVLFDNNQNAQQINNPNYSLYDNRLLTLRDWPVYSTRLPGKVFDIAKSGLYYNGTTKDLRCFHCDIELRTWDHGMDPAEEHARKNPNCPFLQNDPAHADLARQFLLQQISGQNSGVQAQH